jgi:hypothetical protein
VSFLKGKIMSDKSTKEELEEMEDILDEHLRRSEESRQRVIEELVVDNPNYQTDDDLQRAAETLIRPPIPLFCECPKCGHVAHAEQFAMYKPTIPLEENVDNILNKVMMQLPPKKTITMKSDEELTEEQKEFFRRLEDIGPGDARVAIPEWEEE